MRTIRDTLKAISDLGMAGKYDPAVREFRVNYPKGREGTAYYTDDREDAVGTARLMAAQRPRQTNPQSFMVFARRNRSTDYHWYGGGNVFTTAKGDAVPFHSHRDALSVMKRLRSHRDLRNYQMGVKRG